MNNYMKFLADLINVDVEIKEEDNAVIFWITFVLTLINSKQTLNYSDKSAALVNYEVQKKNK